MLRLLKTFLLNFSLVFLISCSFLVVLDVNPLHAKKKQAKATYSFQKVKKEVQEIFKNTKIVDVKMSEIEGVYEIYYEGEYPGIFYYYPKKKLIIFGEIFSTSGVSLTGEKVVNYFSKKIKKEGLEGEVLEDGREERGKEK